jgi:hypothetical protein
MVTPTVADYVSLLFTLFEHFMQQHPAQTRRGPPFVYPHKALLVFVVVMQQRPIFRFQVMRRWLVQHPEARQALGLETMPARATLSRRYKALYPVVQDFIAFVGQYAEHLDPRLDSQDLYTDKSLFKAQGPVWHQSDRCAGRLPEKLRHLDTDASWGKSGYHGWVYGYGLHLAGNRAGIPKRTGGSQTACRSPPRGAPMPRLCRCSWSMWHTGSGLLAIRVPPTPASWTCKRTVAATNT